MFRLLTKISMFILFIGCVNAFAGEYCSQDSTTQKLNGDWVGSDSYYFSIRMNDSNKICITILEDGTTTVRNIRDIVIIDGKLRHLSYFTPITKAYVVYTNIEISGNDMNFDWYSSYDNRGGKDTYSRKPEKRGGAPMTENRVLPVENLDLTKPEIFGY
jgi:hypothetical protein